MFLSGLSSFFRDILVSKNKLSHKLLNYDESKINKLIDLGSALNYEFLIEYINILNESEINFQKSINQRLLVELSILKISSIAIYHPTKSEISPLKLIKICKNLSIKICLPITLNLINQKHI